jgi:tRNA U34 5-carboxymethylaminomethyl modifying enzyme MnmG/GidA
LTVYKPEEYIKKNLQSSIRNEKIAKLLFLSKSIEQFGSGFKRIDSLCKDAGVKYSYENGQNGFKFIIKRNPITSDTADVTSDVTTDVTSADELNLTEKTILAILKSKPDASRDELAEKASKTVRTVQRTLNSLRDKGYIERERVFAEKMHKLDNIRIKGKFDYANINDLSTECRHKLERIQPETLAQASRIPGVSPSDINVLLVLLNK